MTTATRSVHLTGENLNLNEVGDFHLHKPHNQFQTSKLRQGFKDCSFNFKTSMSNETLFFVYELKF